MKNKELALRKIEYIKNVITNVKTTAYRRDVDGLEPKFEKLNDLIEELEGLISIEQETLLTRGYEGL
jgi:hypothetical protein